MKKALLLITLLVGCDREEISGIVTKKTDIAPYTSSYMIPHHIGKMTMLVTHHVDHPEAWEITLRDGKGAPHTSRVSKKVWDKVREGDRFIIP